jgi:hypothetical protein
MPDQTAEQITLADRFQALAQELSDELDAHGYPEGHAARRMTIDMREAAALLEGADSLLKLILVDMATATNRDLASDGPVGDAEGAVWQKIKEAAEELRERFAEAAPEPGPEDA